MTGLALEALDEAMRQLFQLRGVLDPSQTAAGLGVSVSEALALRHLSEGSCTQQDLGAHLSLEKSTVSRLVDAMVSKDWVAKERNPDNRRYQTIALTPAGVEAAKRVTEAIRQRHASLLATLSPKELQAVTVALPALIRALSHEPDARHAAGSESA